MISDTGPKEFSENDIYFRADNNFKFAVFEFFEIIILILS